MRRAGAWKGGSGERPYLVSRISQDWGTDLVLGLRFRSAVRLGTQASSRTALKIEVKRGQVCGHLSNHPLFSLEQPVCRLLLGL